MIFSVSSPTDDDFEEFLFSSLTYISPGLGGRFNYRYCYQMYTALNEPFDCMVGKVKLKNSWGLIVNQNVIGNFELSGQVLVHFIDLESRWGKIVKELLNGNDFIETETIGRSRNCRIVLPLNYLELSSQELSMQIAIFLKCVFMPEIQVRSIAIDARIANVMDYVKQNVQRKIKLESVAEHVHLSPERLRHLFTEKAGMPFSQYVLWMRVKMVIKIVSSKNMPVSKVCTQFGFTDYSHFSRVFKGIFGITPYTLFRYCRVVNVLVIAEWIE